MANDVLFQHLVRHLYPYYYVEYCDFHDFGRIEPFVPKGYLRENLFHTIAKSMYVLEDFLISSWVEGLKQYFSVSLKDFEIYIMHVILFCMEKKLLINNGYERFINVCALVTVIGVHTFCSTGKEFYKLTPHILTVFFERALKEDFRKHGGWKRLEKYLSSQDYLEYYEMYSATWKCSEKKIVEEFKKKRDEFSLPRSHVFSPFPNIAEMKDDHFVTDLTAEVISSLDASLLTELRSCTLDAMLSTFSLKEKLISDAQILSLKKEICQSSKTSGEDDDDSWDLSYYLCLENHFYNLPRQVFMKFKNSSLDASLTNAVIHLITSLNCLKLKLEHAISLLEPLQK